MSDLLLLCYHAVSESWPAALAVRPDRFEEHVFSLAHRSYVGITLTEALAGASAPAGRAVVITFDDAYRSVIERALPILSDAGFPATVFAPTSFISTEKPMSWTGMDHWLETDHRDELVPMSWPELQELSDAGWEVGSHCRTHPRLTELEDPALHAELVESRTELEQRLSKPCLSLAYPYGAHDARVMSAAKLAGYSAAVATLPGRLRPPTGPYDWPRIVVNRVDSLPRFRAKTSRPMRLAKSSIAWDAVAATRRAIRRMRHR